MKNLSLRTVKTLFGYVKRQWILLLVSCVATVASVLLTLYIPVLIGEAIDKLVGLGQVDFEGIHKLLVEIITLSIVIALLQWATSIINNVVTFKVVKDVRKVAFSKLQTLAFKTLDVRSQGELVNLIITDVQVIGDGLLMGFSGFLSGIVTIVGTIALMISINVFVALIVVVLTPISLFVAKGISKRTYDMFKVQASDRGAQTAVIDEMISSVKTVQALGQEDRVIEKFNSTNVALEKSSLKAIFFSSLVNPSTRFVNALVYASVGVSASLLIVLSPYTISIGMLASLLSYANQYTKPFNEISGIISELQNAFACASRVFAFIDEKDQAPDRENAITLENVEGAVEIKNVYFSYRENQKLIENFNLKVNKGEKIAIVGPTGCGKTTLINLLMRFYDVNSGTIFVDGVDVLDVTRKSLRDGYGMVLQDTWLRNASVRENLTMGEDISEDEIVEVCKICHVHSFVKRLPEGYDTVITENGSNLSTGQKQLLCIARAMLKKPKMLILDEATSNIDTRTEKKINDAFLRLMEGKTTFIVAHRLSTIVNADCILVMKDGHVIEQGKHLELLERNGFYTKLYNSQFAK